MAKSALYAGSFDPVTNGHLDVIGRAVHLVDKLILAIGVHPGKTPLFVPEDRLAMLQETASPIAKETGCTLHCITFDDLVIAAARREGATVLIRGIRDGTDLDYEMQMSGMNDAMASGIRTVFLPASSSVRPITATLVRQIASMGGDISHFVPANVGRRLAARFGN